MMNKGDHRSGEIELIAENLVYETEYSRVYNDDVLFPGGQQDSYLRLEYKQKRSVAVVPVLTSGEVQLIEVFRHGARRWVKEIPKGFAEDGETLEESSRRELQEECGLIAGEMTFLGTIRQNPALTDSVVHLFVARDCEPNGVVDRDSSESIRMLPPIAIDLLDKYFHQDDEPDLLSAYVLSAYVNEFR